eukprot:2906-Pyramimonas_sp.AAC.1
MESVTFPHQKINGRPGVSELDFLWKVSCGELLLHCWVGLPGGSARPPRPRPGRPPSTSLLCAPP